MVYVCQDWFPKGSRKRQREDGFFMEDLLKEQLDIIIKNIRNDWDFTIIITAGGQVRVGKSVLAMQIGAYWVHQLKELYDIDVPFNVENNFILDGRKLIETGNRLGKSHPYSPLIFDEAGADLEGRKVMSTKTQEVLDFYRECGQYNLLNILVLPEFFDLPKGIALSRSICLLDVYYSTDRNSIFQRGYFNFYSKRSKKNLYLKGKKDLDYNIVKQDFRGNFRDFYPINEHTYREIKQFALTKRETRTSIKDKLLRDATWYMVHKELGITIVEISARLEKITGIRVPKETIRDAIKTIKVDNYDTPQFKK